MGRLDFLKDRFNRDVIWNVASFGILGATGILVNLAILGFRGPDGLGVFSQVFSVWVVVSQFAVCGLQFSTLKHCSHEQDDLPLCGHIAMSALLPAAGVAGAAALALYALRNPLGIGVFASTDVAAGIGFVAPGLVLFSINKVLMMTLNGVRHMRAFAVFQAARYLLLLGGVLTAIRLGASEADLALALPLAEGMLCAGLVAYIRLRLFRFSLPPGRETGVWLRRHIAFGLRGFLSGVLIEMNTKIDILMLGALLSDRAVGTYAFAATIAEGFAQLTFVIRQNLDPILGRCFAARDLAPIEAMARRIRRTFVPVMAGIGLLLVLAFPATILLFAAGQTGIWDSWGVLAILVGALILVSGVLPFIALIIQGGRPGTYTAVMAIMIVSNVVLNAICIPLLGIYGAALATGLAYCLQAAIIVLLAKRLFGIKLLGSDAEPLPDSPQDAAKSGSTPEPP